MQSAAHESDLSSLAAVSLPKTRIRGVAIENTLVIGDRWPISSTSWWECGPFYDGIASARVVGHFYPYGQEKPSATQNGTEKFTGYLRDGETGMDYADQRYHVPGTGRFLTPDSMLGSGSPNDPGSWNRYAYVGGDPINRTDPTGHDWCDGTGAGLLDSGGEDDCYDFGSGGGGGGCYIDDFVANPACGDTPWAGCPSGTVDDGNGNCAPVQQPPPCYDDLQMYTRPINIIGRHGVGYLATHQYLQITTTTGQLLDTVEGLNGGSTTPGGPNMLVAGITAGANGPNDNPTQDKKFGGTIQITCDTAANLLEDAADWNPVPYSFYAGIFGPNAPQGANSNTFMHWLLTVSGLALNYPSPPPGASGWYNTPGGGNFLGGS